MSGKLTTMSQVENLQLSHECKTCNYLTGGKLTTISQVENLQLSHEFKTCASISQV